MLFRFDLVRAVLNVDITNWMKKLPRNYDYFIFYKTYICSFYKLMVEIHHNKFYKTQFSNFI
jgi:hypothetical protein